MSYISENSAVLADQKASAQGNLPDEVLRPRTDLGNGVRGHARRRVIVLGGGPAGLTAAYELTKHGQTPVVLEKSHIVGGLSRTESYKGYHFDMGGHRFFTKSEPVKAMWYEVLAGEFLRRPRLSRIYYNKKFFYYPLKPFNALMGLGIFESILIICSYIRWQLFPYKQEETFEEWVTNRFGKRLFLTFFKTYTEKVWGIPCTELKAEWAAQRIKDLSLRTALLNMMFKPKRKVIKTLIEAFDYPRFGPGMMWRAVAERVQSAGGQVRLQSDAVKIRRVGNRLTGVVVGGNQGEELIEATDFISSIPVTEFVKKLDPPPPAEVLEAAGKLTYRDFLTVCLIVNKKDLFPDNWIYIHDSEVQVGRIQNFKNWSPDMLPDPSMTSLGLEYFCSEGDSLWCMPNEELVELAKRELERIGLASYADVVDGCVFRVPKSYPVYDSDYRTHLTTVREYVDSLENFQTIGRNGLHRYNNQDHAMLTGMLAVKNLMRGERNDLWNVNAEQEYHEEVHAGEEAAKDKMAEKVQASLATVFLKVDRNAFGIACGTVLGLLLFLVTWYLLIRGGYDAGIHLLRHYLPGYRVSVAGSMLALGYGLLGGFVLGWGAAFLRNALVFLFMATVRYQTERRLLRNILEYL